MCPFCINPRDILLRLDQENTFFLQAYLCTSLCIYSIHYIDTCMFEFKLCRYLFKIILWNGVKMGDKVLFISLYYFENSQAFHHRCCIRPAVHETCIWCEENIDTRSDVSLDEFYVVLKHWSKIVKDQFIKYDVNAV